MSSNASELPFYSFIVILIDVMKDVVVGQDLFKLVVIDGANLILVGFLARSES